MVKDCIFCKIAKGEIPSYSVYDDNKIKAFLDINPYSKGHLLIIPKKHTKWIWDMDKKDYNYLMEKASFFANVLRKVFDTEWVEEVIAGIGVPHTHIHLLPRGYNDGLGEVPIKPLEPKPSEKEMKEIIERIKSFI